MEKTDLKKTYPFYKATGKPAMVTIPDLNYLMIDGKGDPNTSTAFQQAIETLFSVAYTLKFMVKKGPHAIDYGVMPLEGLWWSDDMTDFMADNKANWQWTAMIMQPPFITTEMYEEAKAKAAAKKDLSAIARMRFEAYSEGTCAQILHTGPFSTEGATIEKLHAFITANDGTLRGKHHEIYLSDFRKTSPEKLKTIIRQPC